MRLFIVVTNNVFVININVKIVYNKAYEYIIKNIF